jgi:hypothetical protein
VTQLHVKGLAGLDDIAMRKITHFPNLLQLFLGHCKQVTHEGFKVTVDYVKLSHLSFVTK